MKSAKNMKKGSIYIKSILVRKIYVEFKHVDNYLKEHILARLKEEMEGKCVKEGYIKRNSVNIVTHSSGVVQGNKLSFDVSFECLVCHPVENMKIKCLVKNVTRAGIRAVYYKEEENPIVLFIPREHNIKNEMFNTIKENDVIVSKVIGTRYKLNDEHISIIGELASVKKNKRKTTKKNY
jgi:DNA-directed RNA polymerase subunit E'/Rpb7|tara:strand:+ start:3399 stop:3938 length:540 start_codon:yes stop_codon:yes gene_type:complete